MNKNVEVVITSTEKEILRKTLADTKFNNEALEACRRGLVLKVENGSPLSVYGLGLSVLFSCVYPLTFSTEISPLEKVAAKEFLHYLRNLSNSQSIRIHIMESNRSQKRGE